MKSVDLTLEQAEQIRSLATQALEVVGVDISKVSRVDIGTRQLVVHGLTKSRRAEFELLRADLPLRGAQ